MMETALKVVQMFDKLVSKPSLSAHPEGGETQKDRSASNTAFNLGLKLHTSDLGVYDGSQS
jgi:hypothetical protein